MEQAPRNTHEQHEPYIELSSVLQELFNIPIEKDTAGDTITLESDLFTLSYTQDDEALTIRNIEVFEPGEGIGKKILEIIQYQAESESLQVVASTVKDEARSFWEDRGFVEGEPGEFYL